MKAVARRVVETRRSGADVVVVVSAMGQTTDRLHELATEVSTAPQPREMDMLLTAGERISMALLAMAIAELGPADLAPSAVQRAIECAEAIRKDWLEPTVAGGWLDHFDADGNLIAKDMPASMCYHMYVLVAELKRSAKKLRKRQFD